MSSKDYVPGSYKNLRDWAQNYLDHLDAIATRIHWAGDVAGLKARLTSLHLAAQAVLDQQEALETAAGQLEAVKAAELPEIRFDTNNLKATRGFTETDARQLEVLTLGGEIHPDTYRPRLSAETKVGRVELAGRKLGADGLNVYVRRKGDAAWRLLAAKRVRFPLDDDTPPATPGQPEEREYQAIGVVGDDEIGTPSDIVSAVFRP